MKKCFLILLAAILALSLCACNSSDAGEKTKIVIAYQYGTAYTPYMIMKQQKLIEKHNPALEVEWKILNSGAAITEGLTAGSIDVAAMGIPPCITGIAKGAPFKIYSGLSAQPLGLLTNNPSIKTLSDITPEDKIATVNIGSIQHIVLAMLATPMRWIQTSWPCPSRTVCRPFCLEASAVISPPLPTCLKEPKRRESIWCLT